jgi:hypothetical protein
MLKFYITSKIITGWFGTHDVQMTHDPTDGLPIQADDHGAYVVWDIREWDGDVDTLEAINEAWVETHRPPAKTGTISVFPGHVVVDGEAQDFISEGWNEASEITGLQHLAIVAEGLQAMAVKNQIDVPDLTMEVFDAVDPAVEWMNEQVEG